MCKVISCVAGGIAICNRGVLHFLAAIPPAMQASKITTGNTEVYLVEKYLKAFLQLYDLA